ncbi:Isy1 [Kluyveromyces lactis]|nr:Isy1 [Kluyveromyces lactis]
MSRNVNKANSVLVRYQELQAAEIGGYQDFSRLKRPTRINKVTKLDEALRWRNELVKEIGQRVTQIHDPSLNESQITEINDELNKLFQEKGRWDFHIRNKLKGPDLKKRKQLNTTGGTLIDGKRYFGRALELPEVQKLLKESKEQREKERSGKEKKAELQRKIKRWESTLKDDYFVGNNSDELLEYEKKRTESLRSTIHPSDRDPSFVIPNFDVPSLKDVELWLVQRRKNELKKQLGL